MQRKTNVRAGLITVNPQLTIAIDGSHVTTNIAMNVAVITQVGGINVGVIHQTGAAG